MTGSKDEKSVPTDMSPSTNVAVEEAETNTNPGPFLIGVGVVAVLAMLATKIDLYSMDQLLGGLTFLGLLSFLIIAHEMGHFWVAKNVE